MHYEPCDLIDYPFTDDNVEDGADPSFEVRAKSHHHSMKGILRQRKRAEWKPYGVPPPMRRLGEVQTSPSLLERIGGSRRQRGSYDQEAPGGQRIKVTNAVCVRVCVCVCCV